MDYPPVLKGAEHAEFARSVLSGLTAAPKTLHARWLYDGVGAKLFEAITKLDHYYPTRTEMAILEANADEIADALGDDVTIVEPGAGEATKVRPLLAALGPRAAGYMPIDIAEEQLLAVADEMAALYPSLAVKGIAADFFRPFSMDKPERAVIFFPGSTVGNMSLADGQALMRSLHEMSGADRFLIGFDLLKDRQTLIDAYDDPAGITAAFKKNVLQRINRELDADFDVPNFAHDVRFNEATSAIEMRLRTDEAVTVTVAGHPIAFEAGEAIHTEDSRKYTLESFADFARGANLSPVKAWTDPQEQFAVMLLSVD
ncbi:L-histidine N(alpha)-methyltransferase [Acuticoccus sp. MNP-M23]|uniref:L-histidine N(alpha)-methyltransferase n=1 Tax=Acuticoccus sp. MNP-M23 TaxID=3072793 RepID=UPI0028150759|nr:L-histidine N(alpha)-methyltransferase [Acuticoccus sp. MNP-M23]WMS44831.1 L-histidine N(alpha)-methyltransferase [Acuticoccus sp. MNP-M23]